MIVLAIAVGAAIAMIIFWPIKKGSGPPGSGSGGNNNAPPPGNAYLPMAGFGGYWIAGHEGTFAFQSGSTRFYDFPNGPGVHCNANACSYVKNDPGFASGNTYVRLADEPCHDGCVNADYTIDQQGWFWAN